MSGKAEATAGGMDVFKLAISLGIVLIGLAAFYIYADQHYYIVCLVLWLAVVIAAVISLTTERGRNLASFMQDARTEVRKMVWPTRAETVQTTIIVFIVVIILALFLWMVDRLLTYLIQFVI